MAITEIKYFDANENIYLHQNQKENKRKIRVEFGMPEKGLNESTGMLVFITGYGAGIDSHVYRRMRNEFCDLYNVITLQCDYFGNKYMTAQLPNEIDELFERQDITEGWLNIHGGTDETEREFNDMGLMQALDIVNATIKVLHEIRRRGYAFNTKKIIIFGVSHGAYLAYLANAICPDLYGGIIDVSGYLIPYNLKNARINATKKNGLLVTHEIRQFLNCHPEYKYDERLYDLRFLYQGRMNKNNCKIIAFHGTKDWMIKQEEKEMFISGLRNAELMVIDEGDVDGKLFKNADHGLGVDFFMLFDMLMPMLEKLLSDSSTEIALKESVRLGDEEAYMIIDYSKGKPELVEITF